MDDILVFGKTTEEHDKHLEVTLHKLQEANLTPVSYTHLTLPTKRIV